MKKFIALFHQQLEETEIDILTPDTKFRELNEWSSFTTLSIIAMADKEYDVKLKGDDIRNSNTIEDLFNLMKS